MNEHTQLKAFMAFLFVFMVMMLSQAAMAAINVSPSVPGYSNGMFSSPAGGFSMTAANDGFIKPAVANVGGKPVTVPATLRMAQNAGQFAKNAMKLNPWGIAGTLAAGWLLSEGLEWLNDQWQKSGQYPGSYATCEEAAGSNIGPLIQCDSMNATANVILRSPDTAPGCEFLGTANYAYTAVGYNCAVLPSAPATDADWDALPDPLPAIAPEVPYAPYLPEGIPVTPPEYDFVPFDAPLGDAYTKPDGSTAQPMAKVSPNGDQVTVDTYDQPLTDTQGNPVPDPQPQDTQEPEQSECQKHPNTIGCSEYGTPPAMETIPTTEIPIDATVTPVGGAGACPASVTVRGITWSYAPMCDFAYAIRPLIIGFAWLGFAYIVAGVVRS